RPPTADRRPPTADRRPPTADRRPPTADRRPPTAGRRPPDAGRRTPDAGRRTPDAGRRRQATTATDTTTDLADLDRFTSEVRRPYGFDVTGVDYDRPAETAIPWPNPAT
ncbi:hypothetical protein ACGFY7_25880, partial [Streptomyces prunicolor]